MLGSPGPTDSVFDVLAAGAIVLAPQAHRLALLGFAGGGLVGPYRALGGEAEIFGVDLSMLAARMFRQLGQGWAGEVSVVKAEASEWLKTQRRFEVIIEDLSQQVPGDVVKPAVSLETLPGRIAKRLTSKGVAVINVLPTRGLSWKRLLGHWSGHHRAAREVRLAGFDNRILLLGHALPPSRMLARALRESLFAIGSSQAGALSVRTLK